MTMLSRAKTWVVNTCWDLFSMEKIMQKSQTFAWVLGLTFFMSLIALIAVIFAYIDLHVWYPQAMMDKAGPSQGPVIMVPREKLVYINGRTYIPIKLVP